MPDWLQPLQPNRRPPSRTPAPDGEGPLSFERAVERFAEGHVSRRTGRPFSSTSRQNIRDNLLGTPLTAFRQERGIEAVAAWNGDLAAEYLRWLQLDLRRDSATIKKVRSQLRSFGTYCDEHFGTEHAAGGALTTLRVSPAADYERRRDAALSPGDAERLLEAVHTGRDHLIVSMLLYTGMRPSELLALKEQHIRLNRTPPVVEIRGTVHDPDATRTQAGFREVPLTVGQNILPRLLRVHLTDHTRPVGEGHLFLSLRNDQFGRAQPLTMEGLKSMLAKLGDASGIRCNAHRFRHTFCTWCAGAGMQMLHLQQLLGHASSDMVAYYYRDKTSETVLEAAARVRF